MKIVGAVVLYNPNFEEVVANIKSYLDFLDCLFVFDNSDHVILNRNNLECVSSKIVYHSKSENMGVAYALNYVCNIAKNMGYSWILTMDQDSSFKQDDFYRYLTHVNNRLTEDVALFSPFFQGELKNQPQYYTSGSIINLNAWHDVGKFDDNLFIDEVDGDFTFRLSFFNYILIKINEVEITHNLGEKISRRILGKLWCSDNHTPIRKYYIARNRIYLMKKRPSMRRIYLVDSFKKFITLLILENDRIMKVKMVLRGVMDGLRNKMGKYNSF